MNETKITPESFCYWLQGFFELTDWSGELTEDQVEMIKEHLQLVFTKETGNKSKKEWRVEIDKISERDIELLKRRINELSPPNTYPYWPDNIQPYWRRFDTTPKPLSEEPPYWEIDKIIC